MFEEIEARVRAALSAHRFAHSLGVAQEAERLARRWGADPQKAYLAGLCHDFAREIGLERMRKIAVISPYGLGEGKAENIALLHANASAYLAEQELGVTDAELLDAIRWHTVGKAGMSRLTELVFLADAIEPGRDWPGVARVRELADQDLAQAMFCLLSGTLDHLRQEAAYIHPRALEACDYYRALCAGTEESANEAKGDACLNSEELLKNIAATVYEKKGSDILSLDLRGISSIADYFLICTANNAVHAKSLCDYVDEKTEALGLHPLRVEGYAEGVWILMDYGDVIVHIFQPTERQFYNLERFWRDAVVTAYGRE